MKNFLGNFCGESSITLILFLAISVGFVLGLLVFKLNAPFTKTKNLDIENAKDICLNYQRGIYKRIDENRELLDLLCKENSDFIKSHWYVVNWIKSQDDFLVKMADTLKIEKPLGRNDYPRKFKSQEESKN